MRGPASTARPASFIGSVLADAPDPAWGGGDPFVPQNLAVTPVLGDRNVAVVIVETSDSTALSAADQGALRTAWQNEVFDGVHARWRARVGAPLLARRLRRTRWTWSTPGSSDRSASPTTGRPTPPPTPTGQTDDWEAFGRAAIADLRAQNEAARGRRAATGASTS